MSDYAAWVSDQPAMSAHSDRNPEISAADSEIPLNIVFAGNFLYPKGMAGTKRVQHFIDSAMTRPNCRAHVLLFRQGHVGRDAKELAGVHRNVNYETVGHDVASDIRLPAALVRYFIRGCKLLRSWRADPPARNVLFVYGEPNIENLLFVLFARINGYRIVFDVVEDAYQVGKDAKLLSRIKAWTSRQASKRMPLFADAVIVISRHLRKKFETIGGRRIEVELIPVSVDLSRVPLSDRGFHDPVRIFYAGSFAEKDCVENLIDAFDSVATDNRDVVLLLTGRGMERRMRIIFDKISASAHSDRIRYLGYLSDDDYYAALCDADVLCVARDASEFADRGFPFKLGEYLASGRPVLASAVGDIPDFVEDGKSGFLVEPGRTDSIAGLLKRLLANEEQALAAGLKGRSIAEENFDSVKNGEKFMRVLRSLV